MVAWLICRTPGMIALGDADALCILCISWIIDLVGNIDLLHVSTAVPILID